MESYGLKGLVINSDTIHDAQLRGEDIWKKAETEPSMVFLSPGFGDLSKDDNTFATKTLFWKFPLLCAYSFYAPIFLISVCMSFLKIIQFYFGLPGQADVFNV